MVLAQSGVLVGIMRVTKRRSTLHPVGRIAASLRLDNPLIISRYLTRARPCLAQLRQSLYARKQKTDWSGLYFPNTDAGYCHIERRSRTQRPQFQPRRLLQCHPGPHPSAIRSTRCASPILKTVGLAKIGRAGTSAAAKVTEITIIAATARITTTYPMWNAP
jgi:hypothetical protein